MTNLTSGSQMQPDQLEKRLKKALDYLPQSNRQMQLIAV